MYAQNVTSGRFWQAGSTRAFQKVVIDPCIYIPVSITCYFEVDDVVVNIFLVGTKRSLPCLQSWCHKRQHSCRRGSLLLSTHSYSGCLIQWARTSIAHEAKLCQQCFIKRVGNLGLHTPMLKFPFKLLLTSAVFFSAHVRHVGFVSLQQWYSFDVGIGWSLKVWCCHKLHPEHVHHTCLHFCLWRPLLLP